MTGDVAAGGTVSDPAALHRLRGVRDAWRAAGLLGRLEDTVAAVWERNVARHDPVVAGDTAVSLGITSAENLRTALRRDAADWEAHGAVVASPLNSVTLTHDDVVLHLMKAPGPGTPDFAALPFTGEVRGAAARANGQAHTPEAGPGAQLSFSGPAFDGPGGPPLAPAALTHVVLVWTGDPQAASTAGWLAVPWDPDGGVGRAERRGGEVGRAERRGGEVGRAERRGGVPARWLAAVPVWAHGPDAVPAPRPVPAISYSFAGGEDPPR